MTRAAICGAALAVPAEVLGLEPAVERPDVVLLDLADPGAIDLAASIPAEVPRVAVGGPAHEALLRALGCTAAFGRSADPAVLGPLVAAAVPARRRGPTRLVVVTGVRGGAGRTLLVANLASRLAERVSVLALDGTGTGALGWWLRLTPGPWSDLEGLVDELSGEHLGIVAAERGRLRVIGGVSSMPTPALVAAVARAAMGVADVTIVDAPPIFDERTRAFADIADRVLVVATDDPVSLAAIAAVADDERTWVIGSRCRGEQLGSRPLLRSLPDDAAAVRAAARGPSAAGGALGHAYDDLAELLAIDIA